MNDLEAIELLKKEPGNEKAIEYLYKTYAVKIIRFLTYKGANPEIAEEVTQEGFLKALKNIQNYEDKSFENWIKTISYNLFKDYLKKQTSEIKDYSDDEGTKSNSERQSKEIHITSEEMQTFIDNNNRAIDGWNDNDQITDNLEEKDIKECLKRAFAKFAKDGGKTQDDRAYVLSLLYIDTPLDEIAKAIDRTYTATKVFISETKKKFMPYSKQCFDLLKG